MNEAKNPTRKTIYIEEELVKQCEILYCEAETESFSQFVVKALMLYIDSLITQNHSPFLTEELKKAIQDEVRPIASRLSKGLYRYAIEIDMLCQILAYVATDLPFDFTELIRKHANARVAKMRGQIDLKCLLDDNWIGDTFGKEENDCD